MSGWAPFAKANEPMSWIRYQEREASTLESNEYCISRWPSLYIILWDIEWYRLISNNASGIQDKWYALEIVALNWAFSGWMNPFWCVFGAANRGSSYQATFSLGSLSQFGFPGHVLKPEFRVMSPCSSIIPLFRALFWSPSRAELLP